MSAHIDQIKSDHDRFVAAWRANDGDAVASFFVEDGALITPFGQRADGRAAIAAMYTEDFGGMLAGTWTTLKLSNVRVVESNHAFVDGEQTIYAADGSVVLVLHLSALLRQDRDSWRFVDSRPYTLDTVPV
ncbi:MAG: SgcJ/EcaC family oxidoreductase [Gemmatimonadaceae bacterium]